MTQFIDTLVGIFQSSGYAVAAVFFPHLIKARMLDQVSGKEHTGLYTMIFHILYDFVSVYALFTGDQESKPAWAGILTWYRKDQLILCSCKTCF